MSKNELSLDDFIPSSKLKKVNSISQWATSPVSKACNEIQKKLKGEESDADDAGVPFPSPHRRSKAITRPPVSTGTPASSLRSG